MYDYIIGKLAELNPAEITVECYGVGYKILISLQTFSAIEKRLDQTVKIFVYHHLREEEELFYGFSDKEERSLFKMLISVSGVGSNTARMMLSSLTADELREAIISSDVNKIKGVKGIGLKTAQRIILELKDKVVKGSGNNPVISAITAENTIREEAMSALVLLGFSKQTVEKTLGSLIKSEPDISLESLIKKALKLL